MYCGNELAAVLAHPQATHSLQAALKSNETDVARLGWSPTWCDGRLGIEMGWYASRQALGGAYEWLSDQAGKMVRTETKAELLKLIEADWRMGASGEATPLADRA